jgi:hypothetical protein
VRALRLERAAFFAQLALDPKAALETFAPTGSEPRKDLDLALGRTKLELGADLEKELLPLLSGHASLSVGLAEDAASDLSALLSNPAQSFWTPRIQKRFRPSRGSSTQAS